MGKEKANVILSLILAMFGMFIAVESYRLGLDTFNDPGPGLFPLTLSIIFCVLVVASGITSRRTLMTGSQQRETESSGDAMRIRKVCIVVGSLIAYLILLDILGFLLDTFLLLSTLLSLDSRHNLLRILSLAAAVDCLAYIIFKVLLQVPLPSGLLPIG